MGLPVAARPWCLRRVSQAAEPGQGLRGQLGGFGRQLFRPAVYGRPVTLTHGAYHERGSGPSGYPRDTRADSLTRPECRPDPSSHPVTGAH